MTKKELASGMFGMEMDGSVFVVVGDKLVYEGGKYMPIKDLTDDLRFDFDHNLGIEALYEATCFQQVKDGRGKLIWERAKAEKETPKEDGAITITEDQFLEAVKAANALFEEIGKEAPGGEMSEMMSTMMGLQNIAFGALIATVLFHTDEDEDDE